MPKAAKSKKLLVKKLLDLDPSEKLGKSDSSDCESGNDTDTDSDTSKSCEDGNSDDESIVLKTPTKSAKSKKLISQESLLESSLEKDVAKLSEYRKILSKKNPAAELIGVRVSPSKSYLHDAPTNPIKIAQSEHYARSDKHYLAKGKYITNLYKKKLTNGDRAHVGDYSNLMQALGDKFEPKQKKMITSAGDGRLYHELLEYRLRLCRYIAGAVNKQKPSFIKCGVYQDYPCLMIYIEEGSVFKSSKTKKLSEAAFEEWVNFLISFFVGIVNQRAVQKNIHIEMERRSSFGFLNPSIAPTGRSFRVNVGVVPRVYADLLIECLNELEKLFTELENDIEEIPTEFPKNCFYGTKAHDKYLGKKYKTVDLDNIIQLLFAQVEKAGKTTVQNVMRTPFARDGIAMEVFKTLDDKKEGSIRDAFLSGIRWAVKKISLSGGKSPKLIFKQSDALQYAGKFPLKLSICEDRSFWGIIKRIVESVKLLKDAKLNYALEKLEECIKNNSINNLYYRLEFLNEMIYVAALESKKKEEFGDGYGSDSDNEEEIGEETLYHKKLITHNGMRAIWSAVITAAKHLENARVYLEGAYYEIPKGIKIICEQHNLSITITRDITAANMIVRDLNPCVTDGNDLEKYELSKKNKILILDTTSSSAKDIILHKDFFAKSRAAVLFLVDSGFKHQQIGADKNQYGTVRIYTREQKLTEKFYTDIKSFEPPLLSGTSHRYRRIEKLIGAVPTCKNFMKAKL